MEKRTGAVCFIVKDNKILLVLIEYAPNDRKWTGIGGFVDEGESPEDAAVREFQEETYIEVEKKDLKKVKEYDSYLNMKLIVFITKKWKGEIKAKEDSLKEFSWFEFDKIPYDQMHEDNKDWLPGVLISSAGGT